MVERPELVERDVGAVVAPVGAVGAPPVKVHPLAGELEIGRLFQSIAQFSHSSLTHGGVMYAAAADADQIGMRRQVCIVTRLLLEGQFPDNSSML